ncbi:hypothetical protein ACA910_019503 [Epithemia clementina (nom. ined.)]
MLTSATASTSTATLSSNSSSSPSPVPSTSSSSSWSKPIHYYDLTQLDSVKTLQLYKLAVQQLQELALPSNLWSNKNTLKGGDQQSDKTKNDDDHVSKSITLTTSLPELAIQVLLVNESTCEFLWHLARLDVFSKDFTELFHMQQKLQELHCLKKLKYFLNLSVRETLYWYLQLAVLESKKMEVASSKTNHPHVAGSVLNVADFFPVTDDDDKSASWINLKFKTVLSQNFNGLDEIMMQATDKTKGDANNTLMMPGGLSREVWDEKREQFWTRMEQLENMEPHALYPTSIYRQSDGCTVATPDSQAMEAVMSTTLTTSIRIESHVLAFNCPLLAEMYRPLGRVVIVLDDKLGRDMPDTLGLVEVATNYRVMMEDDDVVKNNQEKYVQMTIGEQLDRYFAHHDVETTVLLHGGNEVDKDIENVQQILIDLKKIGAMRNEPVLVVGGGVLADIAGFACSLFHRNTPYVMLATSIVAGIDAGPSPRTCCDGQGFKNAFGAIHPPVLTLTDRTLWRTMHAGMIRHGLAEIVKMAVVENRELFELLERVGPKYLVKTKFGTDMAGLDRKELAKLNMNAFQADCERIVGLAMESYVRAEYGNLWETHQCRPHAYGHTWSPGYEMPAGLLHGHAVATCMGFGAYLSWKHCYWIDEDQFVRICKLINNLELSLWHDIMDDKQIFHSCTKKMIQKRGGNLAAPIPRGEIGECGYLNDISDDDLSRYLDEYKDLVTDKLGMERRGYGVEPLLEDVGLAETATASMAAVRAEISQDGQKDKQASHGNSKTAVSHEDGSGQPQSYNDWIKEAQAGRNADWKFNVTFDNVPDTPSAPHFPHNTLFHNHAEEYAMSQTSVASSNVQVAAKITVEENLFAPCMVGSLESQFLKMMAQNKKATRVLDIGTFTGMSAIAFAEGALSVHSCSGAASSVVVDTLEFDLKTAKAAQKIFDHCEPKVTKAIQLHHGNAVDWMRARAKDPLGPVYDIIFIDADKDNYMQYYDLAMGNDNEGRRALLAPDGIILADNTLSALVYDESDNRRVALHQFNQHVKNDPRVEQVVLTLREGVTMISHRRNN